AFTAVALATRVQPLFAGGFWDQHRGVGTGRLQASERRAGYARAAAICNAQRQGRVVFAAAKGAGPRSAAELRGAQPDALAGAERTSLTAGPRHRRQRKELASLALPRSAVGAEGLA